MPSSVQSSFAKAMLNRWQRRGTDWLRDTRGAAALEFAIVALPFFLFVFAILGSSLYFFAVNSLEHGVEAASRKIRTGEAKLNGTSIADFRQSVCDEAGGGIDCNKLRVLIQNSADWAGITPQGCLDGNGQMVSSTGAVDDLVDDYSGDASFIALITLCYEWDLANTFHHLMLGAGPGGSGAAIMQASTAFRIEPHPYE